MKQQESIHYGEVVIGVIGPCCGTKVATGTQFHTTPQEAMRKTTTVNLHHVTALTTLMTVTEL